MAATPPTGALLRCSVSSANVNLVATNTNDPNHSAATAIVAQGTTNPPARHSQAGQGGKGGSRDEASQKWQAQGVRGVTPCEGVRGVIGGRASNKHQQ